MIGRDEKMLIVFEWIRTAAKSDISVLILGPTGSGKEVVARMIHELSRRSVAKFQAVNCAALPDTLFESEIFGYEKGAFTGAHDRKPGRPRARQRGHAVPRRDRRHVVIAQAKLLRVLEERRFERLGGHKSISVDFRLISATNRPLEQFVRDGRASARISTTASTPSPSGCPRCASVRSTSRCWRSASSPAIARRRGCRSTAKVFRRRRWRRCAPISGPATSASWKARCRARRCRRRADRSGRRTSSSCTPRPHRADHRRSPAVARRGRAHAHRPRPGGDRLEQEGSGAGAGHQPRHPLPENPRVPARARSAAGGPQKS